MGHIVFLFLHLMALLFGFIGLFFTIPLHLIYCAVSSRKPRQSNISVDQDNSQTKKCPFCAEEIKKEAIVCKHCNREINVDSEPEPKKLQCEHCGRISKDVKMINGIPICSVCIARNQMESVT